MENQKLELKHLSPYLPHGLKFRHFDDEREIYQTCEIAYLGIDEVTLVSNQHEYTLNTYDVNPILRPMSDLTSQIKINDLTFTPMNKLWQDDFWLTNQGIKDQAIDFINSSDKLDYCFPLSWWNLLFEWHFDVFGLIEKSLAIDINTLNS